MGHGFLREIAVLCGLALLVGGGYWQGRQTGRWEPLPEQQRVDFSSVSKEIGDWQATDFELDSKHTQIAGIDSYLARHYEHQVTGEVINVLVLCGQGGPISVHPPEVCFAGQGYQRESKTDPISMPETEGVPVDRFNLAVFRGPDSTEGHRVQILWGWTASTTWSVPANPRLAFARMPRLYKMYVSRSLRSDQSRQDYTVCLELMQLLIPEIRRCVLQAAGDSPSSPGSESASRNVRSSERVAERGSVEVRFDWPCRLTESSADRLPRFFPQVSCRRVAPSRG